MRVTNEGPIRPLTESVTGIGGSTTPPEDCCDVEPDDLPDEAANPDGLGPQSAWVLEDIGDTPTDQNLATGTDSNGTGATVLFVNPTRANNGNNSDYAEITSGVYGTGTFTGYLVADLGADAIISTSLFYNESNSGVAGMEAQGTATVQHSPDGTTWTETGATPVSTTPSSWLLSFTFGTPITDRYWRLKFVMVTAGFHHGIKIFTWQLNGGAVLGEAWSLPAPEVIDVDDATYVEVDGPDVVRIDLGSEKTIARSRLRIGTATAGAKTYNIDAWNEVDESDRVTLATFSFTGTGSLTAQDVITTWFNVTPYEWYELDGNDEDRRIFSWELYGATLATNHQHDASTISYDNTASGLTGDTVQEAIDELATGGGGFADPMTTRGDIIVRDASNTTDRLGVGSAGEVLTSDGTDVGWSPAAGGLALLEQHTASSSAQLDFTTFISSSFDEYQVEIVNLVPASNGVALVAYNGSGGGPTYDTTSGHYFVPSSDSRYVLAATVANNAGYGHASATFRLFSPQSTSLMKNIVGHTVYHNGSAVVYGSIVGLWTETSTVMTAMRFAFSSGNIASGTIRIYGLAK